MSKRVARGQITRNPHEQEFSDSDGETPATSLRASADVLAKRTIIKPRQRKQTSSSGSASNAFSAFSGFKPSSATPDLPKNGFSFGSAPVTDKPLFLTPPASSFGLVGATTGFNASPNVSKSSENATKDELVRALNEKFVDSLSKTLKQGGIADFSASASKYIEYYKRIQLGEPFVEQKQSSNVPFSASMPLATSATKEAENTAPLPKTGQSTPAFSFGAPAIASAPSNSTPAFSFGASTATTTSKTTSAPAFSFNTAKSVSNPTEEQKEPIKPVVDLAPQSSQKPVEVESSSDEESEEEIKIQGPLFSLSSKPIIKNSPFSFGPKKVLPKSDSDSESEVEIKGPVFNFNKPIKDNVFKLPALTNGDTNKFSFSSSNPEKGDVKGEEKGEEKVEDAVASTEQNSAKEQPKPAFSFGNLTPAFSFSKETTQNKPAFSFGASSSSGSTPAFSFGKKDDSGESKPFNGSGSTVPAFSFGSKEAIGVSKAAESKEDESKPLFSFGNAASSTSAPGSSTSSAPAFSFGNSAPAFSFGKKPEGANGFSFQPQPVAAKAEEKKDEELVEEESTATFAPVAQMGEKIDSTTTGEEDETSTYTKRAKLMLFDAQNKETPYTNKGLGELKVLKNKNTGKTRVLLRADGSSRVLLNSLISKEIKYDKLGNGSMVRVPVVGASGLETYVVRVKTPADGDELLSAIEAGKE